MLCFNCRYEFSLCCELNKWWNIKQIPCTAEIGILHQSYSPSLLQRNSFDKVLIYNLECLNRNRPHCNTALCRRCQLYSSLYCYIYVRWVRTSISIISTQRETRESIFIIKLDISCFMLRMIRSHYEIWYTLICYQFSSSMNYNKYASEI